MMGLGFLYGVYLEIGYTQMGILFLYGVRMLRQL